MGDACDSDDDNDQFSDSTEAVCGSNSLFATSRPERVDGVFTGADDDGDGQIDEPLPPNTEWEDCDGDGFRGGLERSIFSASNMVNDQKKCGVAAWPPDINNDGLVDIIGDISRETNEFGERVPPASARYDIAPDPPDGYIDVIGDITRMTGFFAKHC